jgi:hypothetical protein
MAIIVEKLKLIYFSTPGTGSTATGNFLVNNYECKNVPETDIKNSDGKILVRGKHSSFPELKKANLLNEQELQYLRVTGVRNPYDFLYAQWYRSRTRWINQLGNKKSWIFNNEKKIREIVDCVIMDFSEWVIKKLKRHYKVKRQFLLHEEYLTDMNMFVRMENIDEDMSKVLSQCLGVPEAEVQVSVPEVNVTKREREYWKFYAEKARTFVEFVYKPYLSKFNYFF